MAAPPNAPYPTSQNGSSQEKVQATYSSTGHCSRCVRTYMQCQQVAPPQQSGYPPHVPPPNSAMFQQQQQHPVTCPCPTYSLPTYTIGGQSAFCETACIQVDKLASLPFDRPDGRMQYEQQVKTMPLEYFQRESESAATAVADDSVTRLHPMLMQENITEEATVDEDTETSALPSQRDSDISTRQETSSLSRQEDEGSLEWDSEEDTNLNETVPSRPLLKSEHTARELRSGAMQANISQDQRNSRGLKVADKPGNLSENIKGTGEYDESHSRRESLPNKRTLPKHPSLDQEGRSDQDSGKCQRVMDCLQQCYKKLEEIQHLPGQNAPGNTVCGYCPQRRDSIDNPQQIRTAPVAAPLDQTNTPSRVNMGQKSSLYAKQGASRTATTSGRSLQSAVGCKCQEQQEKPQSDTLLASTDTLKSSVIKSEPTLSKKQPKHISGLPQSDSLGKYSTLPKSEPIKTECVAAKQQQASGSSGPFGKKSAMSKDQKTEPQPPISGVSGRQFDSTPAKYTPNLENSMLYAHQEECETKQQLHELEEIKDVVPTKLAQSVTQEFPAPRNQSKLSEMNKLSQSEGLSKRQEPPEFIKTEKMTPRESVSKRASSQNSAMKSAFQQDPPLKQSLQRESVPRISASQLEWCTEKSALQQGGHSKRSASQQDSVMKSTSQKQSPMKQSASQQDWDLQKSTPQPESNLETSFTGKQPYAQPSELRPRSRSVSKAQVLKKPPDILPKTSLQRPAAQSSIQRVPASSESKQLKTQQRAQKTSPSCDQIQGEQSQQNPLQTPRKILQPQAWVTETPPPTPDSADAQWRKLENETNVPGKPSTEKVTPTTRDKEKTKEREMSPLKGTNEVNTPDKETALPIKSDQKNRLLADGTQSSSLRKQSLVTGERLLSTSEKTDQPENPQTGGEKPPPYCVHPYYLPLYQCAFCQQITPYPVSCQMGVVGCCPSPYDPCQCMPVYPSNPPFSLPCPSQEFVLPYPQPCPSEQSEPPDLSPRSSKLKESQPVSPYLQFNNQTCYEPAEQCLQFNHQPSSEPSGKQEDPDEVDEVKERPRKDSRKRASVDKVSKPAEASLQSRFQQAEYGLQSNQQRSSEPAEPPSKPSKKQEIRKEDSEGKERPRKDSGKRAAVDKMLKPAEASLQSRFQQAESGLQSNQQQSSEPSEPPSKPSKKQEIRKEDNEGIERPRKDSGKRAAVDKVSKPAEASVQSRFQQAVQCLQSNQQRSSEPAEPPSKPSKKQEVRKESNEGKDRPRKDSGKRAAVDEVSRPAEAPLQSRFQQAELGPQFNQQSSSIPAVPLSKPSKKQDPEEENKGKKRSKIDSGKTAADDVSKTLDASLEHNLIQSDQQLSSEPGKLSYEPDMKQERPEMLNDVKETLEKDYWDKAAALDEELPQPCHQPCHQPCQPCHQPCCPLAVEQCPQSTDELCFETELCSELTDLNSEVSKKQEYLGKESDVAEKSKENEGKLSKLYEGWEPTKPSQELPLSFQPASPYFHTNRDICLLSCENVTCSTTTSYITRSEYCICQGLCQSCQANESSVGKCKGCYMQPNQFGLQNYNSKLSEMSVSSGETKKDDGDEDIHENLKDEYKIPPTAIGNFNEISMSGTNKKHGRDHGRNEMARRESTHRKSSYEKDGSRITSDEREKSRRGKPYSSSEEIRSKGSSVKIQRSPHRPASAKSESSGTSKQTTSEEGKSRKLRVCDGESHIGRQADTKKGQATEWGDPRKTGRSLGQSIFQRTVVGPTVTYKGAVRVPNCQISPAFQTSLSKTMLRKLELAQTKRDLLAKTVKTFKTKKDLARIDKVPPIPIHPVLGEHVSGARGGTTHWSPSLFQDRSNHKHMINDPMCSFDRPNNGTIQKSTTETKGGQIKTKTTSIVEAPCASNDQLRSCSRRYPYPDNEKRRNVFSPYYLAPGGAPHRALGSSKRHKLTKRLQVSNPSTHASSETSQHKQPKVLDLPSSSSSSVSSIAEDTFSCQSEDPSCGLWQESQCSCPEWINGASFPEYHNCCAQMWANAPHFICPMHRHHMCLKASFPSSGQRCHPKAKPLSLRSQKTRRMLLRGKLPPGEQRPR